MNPNQQAERSRPLLILRAVLFLWMLLGLLAVSGVVKQPVSAHPAASFQKGDVLAAGMAGSIIKHYSSTGTLTETLNNGLKDADIAGMCVDGGGNLYGTLITNKPGLSKFNPGGGLVDAQFGSAIQYASESCIVDASGNMYVGTNYGTFDIHKLDASGNELAIFDVATDARGSDWIDLSADQCTMLYTSEGTRILRYNVCTKTQLPDFATGLEKPLYALRIRPNGEVMAASANQVYRLSATGSVLQTYPKSANNETGQLFALNLDPDGTTFWTGTLDTDNVYHIDIASGSKLTNFSVGPNADFAGLAGLLIYGELTQARPSSPPPAATVPAPAPSGMSIQAPRRLAVPNDLVLIPITLNNAVNVANLNFELQYDAAVIRPEGDILKGNLLDNALFRPNATLAGRVLAGFAQTSGVQGTGTVMNVPFRIVGKPGDRSPLNLTVTTINDPQGGNLTIERIPGEVVVMQDNGAPPPGGGGGGGGTGGGGGGGGGGIQQGDCDGDGHLTELDALCALEMSTAVRTPRLIMDMDGDGSVTSRDAVIILQKAVGQ